MSISKLTSIVILALLCCCSTKNNSNEILTDDNVVEYSNGIEGIWYEQIKSSKPIPDTIGYSIQNDLLTHLILTDTGYVNHTYQNGRIQNVKYSSIIRVTEFKFTNGLTGTMESYNLDTVELSIDAATSLDFKIDKQESTLLLKIETESDWSNEFKFNYQIISIDQIILNGDTLERLKWAP